MTLATGGTVTYSGGKTIHTFTSDGNLVVTASGNVDYLVVAAGGGSVVEGGGGGAGDVLPGTDHAVTAQTYAITVGAGVSAANGQNSVFDTITAVGGGAGGEANTAGGAEDGGSGGGGGRTSTSPTVGGTATGSGYAGGTAGTASPFKAAGGGGAGGVGDSTDGATDANGGAALSSSISGAAVDYGRGGGNQNARTAGTANTGNGAGSDSTGVGGNIAGGSGIVIISYLPTMEVVPGAGSITITGYVPTVSPLNIDIPLGELTFTGYAPVVALEMNTDVPPGALTVIGYAPLVGNEDLLIRTSDGLTFLGSVGDGAGVALFPDGENWYALRLPALDDVVTVVGHGATGATETIDWSESPIHTCTLDDDCTFAFTRPPIAKHLTLIMEGNGTAYTPVFPDTVVWVTPVPTWTGTEGKKNIASMIWDGENYITSGGDAQ